MDIFGIDIPGLAAAYISAIIALGAFMVGWLQWRDQQYRKDDVLKWAMETIRSLQTLSLVASLDDLFDAGTSTQTLWQIAVDTSVLVEEGRLFFRNVPDAEHGQEKLPAYRGRRPEILDPIVTAHQIACAWQKSDREKQRQMAKLAEQSLKSFVSMAQHEVGRSKTLSRETAKAGKGPSLQELMEKAF